MSIWRRLLSANALLASLLLSLGVFSPSASVPASVDRLQTSVQTTALPVERQLVVDVSYRQSSADDNQDDQALPVQTASLVAVSFVLPLSTVFERVAAAPVYHYSPRAPPLA